MFILGIETSCDETAAALVEASGGFERPRFHILSNVISSQAKLHAKYGGVVPMLASREHEKNLPRVVEKALRNRVPDFIAVTVGPGLEPSLWRGITFATDLAEKLGVPLLGVNHLEGHIYSNWIEMRKSRIENRKIEFPAVCLIVSGGHTELVLMKGYGNYALLGSTRDDAVGEAYDKVARLLGLGYPGGSVVDALASKTENRKSKIEIRLPRPMIRTNDYDFSFAGLKTAVRYLVQDLERRHQRLPVEKICAEFQRAAVEVLVAKTLRAARNSRARNILVSGGVSANSGLRRAFADVRHPAVYFPAKGLSTDNAVMIATAGYFNWLGDARGIEGSLAAEPNLKIG